MSRLFLLAVAVVGLLVASGLSPAEDAKPADHAGLPPAAARTVDFQRDIRPLFARACLSCHGAAKQRGGLRLDDGAAALKGGDSGAVLKPGDAVNSRLLRLVAGLDPDLKMPPGDRPPLGADEVGLLRAWIEQGAKWPQDGAAAAAQAPRSAHWSFQPVRSPAPPRVSDPGRVRNPIDAFVLARLDAEKLTPSAEADRVTLIRRLSLDLLGLPPEPREVEDFLADTRSDAYERLVDRLLASPHYGERWARHWLDMARYADSDGFEKDTGRPHAWRYRHWVIAALNRDLPFDQFTIEQLAGDLLPPPLTPRPPLPPRGEGEKDKTLPPLPSVGEGGRGGEGATTEQKVATGFHRNTLTNREGGVDREQFRVEQVVDRVNTTARVFLGLTLGCCQCHDHKYDPLTQREYYQFFAFFNSDVEVDIPAPLPAEPPPKKGATGSMAQTLTLGPPRKTHVLIRGDFLRPGVEVQSGTPAVLPPLQGEQGRTIPRPPTRLDLARWIVSPSNPLTARVLVNWVWLRYFGRGLVATPEDFGSQGEKPSHPELLDWLASEVRERGWSLKRLHRLIVTSATYRQASRLRPELAARDPLNVLLARQSRQRLEAEVVRDAALASSGLLTRTVGGPSVRPPQPAGISELTYAGSAKWVESTGPDRYRRGLYTWFQRTSPYPMLMTFDAPDSNLCCVRRERSNTPLQALTLLNDTVFVECAQALGGRILREAPAGSAGADATRERLRHGFRLCVARAPSATELARLTQLLEEFRGACRARPEAAAKLVGKMKPGGVETAEAAAWMALARTLLNLDEFVTRE
jgi:hypothetical protein